MIVIKNILVATDFSEPSAAALNYARELSRSCGARLHVLHVADDLRWRYSLDMTPALAVDVQDDIEMGAREKLARFVTEDDRRELHAVTSVVTSPVPAEAIVEYARRYNIDLIVMGTHGRGPVSHFFIGSVAERVVRTAPCPVLTVRPGAREILAPDALVAVRDARA